MYYEHLTKWCSQVTFIWKILLKTARSRNIIWELLSHSNFFRFYVVWATSTKFAMFCLILLVLLYFDKWKNFPAFLNCIYHLFLFSCGHFFHVFSYEYPTKWFKFKHARLPNSHLWTSFLDYHSLEMLFYYYCY